MCVRRIPDYAEQATGIDLTPCQRFDPELWFSPRPPELELAKAHCQHCPLRVSCLSGAIARREPHGVWGGHIIDRGVIVAFKRGRGRPRKTDPEKGAA
jgi:WhiB family redox-sensing transcriptional regulator